MATNLFFIELSGPQDVVRARQFARQVAQTVGFDAQDQVRLATAVSEVARGVLSRAGRGKLEFLLDSAAELTVGARISGVNTQGVAPLDAASEEVIAARRIVDRCDVDHSADSTIVNIEKALPRSASRLSDAEIGQLRARLAAMAPHDPYQEFQSQNRELLLTLADLRRNQVELAQVNQELAETNRGVVALYAELEQKADSLRKAAEEKSRFYSSMSHELRTPISSILSLSRMLQERIDGPLSDGQEKQVELIQKSAQNLLEWVNDLLDLAKAEAGRLELRPHCFRATEMISGLRGVMRPLQTRASVTLVFESPPPELELETDEGKLVQILRNFVSNALKFTECGEVRVTCEVLDDQPEWIRFCVIDTGIGIALADQARVFDEFVQVDSFLQRGVKGTGLGLPLARKLAQLLGGDTALSSRPGSGSVFSVTIPRVASADQKADRAGEPVGSPMHQAAPPAARAAATAPPESATILLIDDDEASRYLLRSALREYGFRFADAATGKDGLRLAETLRPSMVFLDLNLPDQHGSHVLASLKTAPVTAQIPTAIYSSDILEPELLDELGSRTVAVIRKPIGDAAPDRPQIELALARAGLLPLPQTGDTG